MPIQWSGSQTGLLMVGNPFWINSTRPAAHMHCQPPQSIEPIPSALHGFEKSVWQVISASTGCFFLECSHVCIFRISSTLEKKDQVLLSLDLLECQLDIVVGDSVLFRFWVHKNWLTLKAGQNLMAFILISIINRLVCLQKLHDLIWGHVHTRHIELSVVFAPLLVRCFNNRLWLSWTKSCKLDCRFVALLTACFEPCHDKNASPLQKRGFRPFIYKKLSGCRLLLLFA